MDLLRILIAILLPPLGVFLQEGLANISGLTSCSPCSAIYPASCMRCGSLLRANKNAPDWPGRGLFQNNDGSAVRVPSR